MGPAGTSTAAGSEPGYLAGNYEKGKTLGALPPLLPLRIQCGDRVFGSDASQVKDHEQSLRLKEGVLETNGTWDSGAGQVSLELTSALPYTEPNLALVVAKVKNDGSKPVWVGVPDDAVPPSGPLGGEALPGYFYFLKNGIDTRLSLSVLEGDGQPTDAFSAPQDGFRTRVEVPAGMTVQVALATSVRAPGAGTGRLQFPFGEEAGKRIDGIMAAHRKAWEARWAGDIEIEGDAEAQEVVRACLFQLFCSVRENSDDGVPPMGLSAKAFEGHVFWDMDSWMFPALLPQHPELAASMAAYRLKTLPGAVANAKAEKLPGASYAWESASTGEERLIGNNFNRGRHVTGDVSLALKQYWLATGDKDWLRQTAWPILKATADNWAARAKPSGKGFDFPRVSTPDENAGLVDHSAWTQHVAKVNLEFATEAAGMVRQPASPKWKQVAEGLEFLKSPDGLILPYKGFTEKSKAKQADALLLFHPGELDLPEAEMGRMYDFYSPRVISNGPAMTDAIEAIVAARLGRGEEALKQFQESYRPFVRPPFHAFSEKRSRDNLSFMTGAAGVVEAVVYGFGGLQITPNGATGRPVLKPHLPPGWTALRLKNLQWRGKRWDVEIKPDREPVWLEVRRK